MSEKVRVAPNSRESEMIVLGCMLTNVNSLNAGSDGLNSFDFYYTEHQFIFDVLKTAYRNNKPADVHLVAEELKRQNNLKAIGDVSYLMTLAQYAGTSAYIEEYVQIVKNKSILRQMINAAQGIEKTSLEEPADVNTALDDAQAKFFAISQNSNHSIGTHIKDLISGLQAESGLPYLKELEERQQQFREKGPDEASITGVRTHFSDLDTMINGLGKSNLIIIAGRPAMGKTALALNIAENACFQSNLPVGVFSLEMGAEQLLHRMICSQAEVESSKIQTGALSGLEYQRIVGAVKMMQKHTMVIDDQPGLRVTELRARARRMKEAFDIQLLVVDYLQLLSGSQGSLGGDNRQGEISEISRMLKNLARELNIPIVCPSQLSRRVEERTGHRPMMSDLRESGAIEQDADVVAFILRREYYDPYDKPGMAEIIIGKNRHGKVGSVDLAYRKELAQFANYTPTQEADRETSSAFSAFTPK
ncbi:MAG: replicative DNA helicase [Simkaniaceae bacterium]|nr:replicative DNA helicase [Simkaniaceae bacterium]